MAKPKNSQMKLAQEAAKRIDEARAIGEQFSFLPDEPGRSPAEVAGAKVGRPKGATGKGSSQLRKWLAAKGLTMPEEQLAEMAGLASGADAMTTAMIAAERVLAWAFDKAKDKDGKAREATPEARIAMFSQIYATQLRAADALMPYGNAKASPDVQVQQAVQVVVQGGAAPSQNSDLARDVTPAQASGLVPADVAWQIQQNQGVSGKPVDNSDAKARTDEASD